MSDYKKKKQTYGRKEEANGYQEGEGRREGQGQGYEIKKCKTMHKINKLQGYIVQHREYSQYFIITVTGP